MCSGTVRSSLLVVQNESNTRPCVSCVEMIRFLQVRDNIQTHLTVCYYWPLVVRCSANVYDPIEFRNYCDVFIIAKNATDVKSQ
jgi:hypothetical protein